MRKAKVQVHICVRMLKVKEVDLKWVISIMKQRMFKKVKIIIKIVWMLSQVTPIFILSKELKVWTTCIKTMEDIPNLSLSAIFWKLSWSKQNSHKEMGRIVGKGKEDQKGLKEWKEKRDSRVKVEICLKIERVGKYKNIAKTAINCKWVSTTYTLPNRK